MANESTRIDKSLSFRVLASPPPNPAMDELYFDLTAQALLRWNGATWAQAFGGAGSGSKNYLTTYTASFGAPAQNPGNGDIEDGSTLGWSLGTVGTLNANNLPVGTPTFGSGSSSNLSLNTVTGGTQLAGTYSLSYVSSAATTQGDMLASSPFFIDQEDQASVLGFSFSYKAAVGAADMNLSGTSANSFAVAVWDATNDEFLGTAGIFNLIQSSGVGKCTGTFQTLANTEKLNFIVYNANVTASGSSTPTIQQSAPSTPFVGFTALISPTDYVAQSFTFGSSTTVTEFDVYLSNFNGSGGSTFPGTISVQILNDNAGVPNLSSVVATSTNSIDTSTFPPNSSFSVLNTFNFNPTILAPGTTYWFAIIPDSTYLSGASSSNHVSLSVTSNGPSYDTYTSGSWSSTASEGFGYNIWGYLTPSSTPVTMLFDDFFVGPQVSVSAPAMTDTVQYTPIFNGVGTPTNVNISSARRGDKLVITGSYITGSVTGSTASISLPSGLSIDTTKLAGTSSMLVGAAVRNVAAPDNAITVIASPSTSLTDLYFSVITNGSIATLSPQGGSTLFSNSEYESLYAEVPIAGWSSNTEMSSDTDTRVVAARAHATNTGTAYANGSPLNYDTVEYDTHGSITTGSGWQYAAPVSGYYKVSASFYASPVAIVSSSGLQLTLYKNGSLFASLGILIGQTSTTINPFMEGSTELYLNSGDLIFVSPGGFSGNPNFGSSASYLNWISIERLSGPAIVVATEDVNARYHTATATITTSPSLVTYTNRDFDSHNKYNLGVYTIPVSGKYHVDVSLVVDDVSGAFLIELFIYKNGSLWSQTVSSGGNTVPSTDNAYAGFSDTVPCFSGDTISIFALATGGATTPTISPQDASNFLSIFRIGN